MNSYVAIFLGDRNSPRWAAWAAMSDAERQAKEEQGIAAWGAWVAKHQDAIVDDGGPLGKTKRIAREGVTDVANDMAVFLVVRAASHEAAAAMFVDHPHFTIFPGAAVEVMPLLDIPGG